MWAFIKVSNFFCFPLLFFTITSSPISNCFSEIFPQGKSHQAINGSIFFESSSWKTPFFYPLLLLSRPVIMNCHKISFTIILEQFALSFTKLDFHFVFFFFPSILCSPLSLLGPLFWWTGTVVASFCYKYDILRKASWRYSLAYLFYDKCIKTGQVIPCACFKAVMLQSPSVIVLEILILFFACLFCFSCIGPTNSLKFLEIHVI